MASENIQTGDIVWLKSGSPSMTVQWVDNSSGNVSVTWYINGKMERDTFHARSLTKEDPN